MSKFAVIKTGGKQYKVAEGDIVTIEKLGGDLSVGGKVVFDEIVLTDDGKSTNVGTPFVQGVKVEGELVEEGKGKKTLVVQYKAKSRHFVRKGHRQPFNKVKITSIK
jgi:large subunit ribosomal protein L21